jgi:hypothetical protein
MKEMATKTEAGTAAGGSRRVPYGALVLGWLVPGAGHLLEGRWVRALLIFVSVVSMFALGIAMHGKLYTGASDMLDMLGFAGDLGSGLLYWIGRLAGLGPGPVQVTTADYGTKFIVVAGLLNFIAAVDAHNISIGRKR